MFDFYRILNILKNKNLKYLKIIDTPKYIQDTILQETNNVFEDCKSVLTNRTVEETCKYILWQGILNDYGVFGHNREIGRKLNDVVYYNQSFKYGDMLSIDFGTTNIGSEFAFTHTGLVLKDFGSFIIVIPVTSQKDVDPKWLTDDLKKFTPPILRKDCRLIRDDSYALFHQIKSVSKNRITKNIGNISECSIMKEIEELVITQIIPNVIVKKDDEIKHLKEQLEICTRQKHGNSN